MSAQAFLFGKSKRSRPNIRSRFRSEDNIKIYLKGLGCENMDSAEMVSGGAP
jgi:hypothetical protein